MKTFNIFAVAGMIIVLGGTAFAQSNAALSPPAQRVLQLSQAQVADSTIIAYVQANPGNYQLTASDIIYLKQQNMSDQVITTMLNQHSAFQSAEAKTPAQPAAANSQPAAVVASQPAPAAVYTQPAPTVIYSAPAYYPAYSYPAYFPFALSFGFGWHGGGGHYHGGYHGGGGFHR